MKEISVENFANDIEGYIHAAQYERLIVTQAGKPLVVLVGVENKDQEDWDLENSPQFWRMIEDRRSRPTMALNQVKAMLMGEK
jgi:prevent-host-death family protein